MTSSRELAATDASPPGVPFAPGRALTRACFALLVVNVGYVAAFWLYGLWLTDAQGFGVPADFVNVWSAGRLVTEGHAPLAYDWTIQKQVENVAIGYDFAGHYGWHYPPPFLFIAAALSALPYAGAFVLWVGLTLAPYLVTIRALVGSRFGWLVAGACPAVLSNTLVGQNGFLTASLIGGTLGLMQRYPALAGVCLGCLTYKPQFGVLFPVVLIAAGQWRVMSFAALTAALIALSSWLAFGSETWAAFFHWLPIASQAFLSDGFAGWDKLQSVFGLVRVLGGGEDLAWALQFMCMGLAAITLGLVWRSPASFDMKAAALAAAVLLATPYVYVYDQVVLAIPAALLIRAGLSTGFYRYELAGLAAAAVLLLIFPLVTSSIGLAATVMVEALALRRCFAASNRLAWVRADKLQVA